MLWATTRTHLYSSTAERVNGDGIDIHTTARLSRRAAGNNRKRDDQLPPRVGMCLYWSTLWAVVECGAGVHGRAGRACIDGRAGGRTCRDGRAGVHRRRAGGRAGGRACMHGRACAGRRPAQVGVIVFRIDVHIMQAVARTGRIIQPSPVQRLNTDTPRSATKRAPTCCLHFVTGPRCS